MKKIIIGSITSLAILTPLSLQIYSYNESKLVRKNYKFEKYVQTYLNQIMNSKINIKDKSLQNYLIFLNTLNNKYIVTSSDEEYVYAKINIDFANDASAGKVYPLTLKHGGHYHVMYLEKGKNVSDIQNRKYLVIRIPIWKGKLSYRNSYYKNEYVLNDENVLNIYKTTNLLEGEDNTHNNPKANNVFQYSSFKINTNFIYELINRKNIVKFKDGFQINSKMDLNLFLKKNSFVELIRKILPISISETSDIMAQYLESIRIAEIDITKLAFYGYENKLDWHYNLYNQGSFLSKSAYDFAYHVIQQSLKLKHKNKILKRKEVLISQRKFNWFIKNIELSNDKYFPIDLSLLQSLGKTGLGSIKFWKEIKHNDLFTRNIALSKSSSLFEDEVKNINFYSSNKHQNSKYFSNISKVIEELLPPLEKSLKIENKKWIRNSDYPFLDIDINNRSHFKSSNIIMYNIGDFGSKINFEDALEVKNKKYFVDNNSFIFKNKETK